MLDRSLPIEYSRHARRRMRQRLIPETEVERIVRNGAVSTGQEGEYLATGLFQGRRFRIPFVEDRRGRNRILVVKSVIVKEG